MKPNPLTKDALAGMTTGFIKVTQKMVQARAGKLAELKGRYACDVTDADLAQARRELVNEAAKP
jgi:hypothetical protein